MTMNIPEHICLHDDEMDVSCIQSVVSDCTLVECSACRWEQDASEEPRVPQRRESVHSRGECQKAGSRKAQKRASPPSFPARRESLQAVDEFMDLMAQEDSNELENSEEFDLNEEELTRTLKRLVNLASASPKVAPRMPNRRVSNLINPPKMPKRRPSYHKPYMQMPASPMSLSPRCSFRGPQAA